MERPNPITKEEQQNMNIMSANHKGLSIWSALFVVLFVVFAILAFVTMYLTVSVTFALIAVISLIVAGFPWGITILWPFWFAHLGGFHFGIIWFSGIWVIISLIIDVVWFVAKWFIFFVLCIVIGWINMFIHSATIVRNVRALFSKG